VIPRVFDQERILARQKVRKVIVRRVELDHALAGIRAHASGLAIDVVAIPEERLLEVGRIVDVYVPGQIVAMARKMLGQRGVPATRHAVSAQPAFFQMRRPDAQRLADPLAGGKAHRRMLSIRRRMRTAVHPDRANGVPCEVLHVNRDELLGILVDRLPDANLGKARGIVDGVNAALVMRQGKDGGVPGARAHETRLVDRQTAVVTELRSGQTIRLILVIEAAPLPHQIDLGRCRTVCKDAGNSNQPQRKSIGKHKPHLSFLLSDSAQNERSDAEKSPSNASTARVTG